MARKAIFCIFTIIILSALSQSHEHLSDLAKSAHITICEKHIKITTERLEITPLQSNDSDFFKSLMNDETCFRSYSSGSRLSDKFLDNLLTDIYKKNAAGDPFSGYIAHLKRSNTLTKNFSVGWIILCRHETSVEISFMIAPRYWHYGYGTELVHAICEELIPWLKAHQSNKEFSHQNIREISTLYAVVKPTNLPSQKILKQLGFVPENTESLRLGDEIIYKALIKS